MQKARVWSFAIIQLLLLHSSQVSAFAPTRLPTTIMKQQHLRQRTGRVTADTKPKRAVAATSLAVAPSGIDQLPELTQAAVFVGYFAALGVSTVPATMALDAISKNVFGLERWRNIFIELALPVLMGLVYLSGGVGHFLAADAFRDIYPPQGTWGLWYLPGSASFHVAWTGVVEALCGGSLLVSAARLQLIGGDDDDENVVLKLLPAFSAATLFVLTLAVTPANIYMFTHGATMGDMEPLDMSFHVTRFTVQVLFLSILWTLAKDSLLFAWGDELD